MIDVDIPARYLRDIFKEAADQYTRSTQYTPFQNVPILQISCPQCLYTIKPTAKRIITSLPSFMPESIKYSI